MTRDEQIKLIEKALADHYAMWWDDECRGCGHEIATRELIERMNGDRAEAWNVSMTRHLAEVALDAIESGVDL